MSNVSNKIGFIGLGNMGAGMANNLLAWCQLQDHQLWVLDLNSAVVDQFVANGAIKANSVSELASAVSVLFTSLPSSKEIALLSLDIVDNLPNHAVWFETSTNELAEWQQIKSRARDSLTLVDAPVTGGSAGAAAGTLTMLLGIDEPVLARHSQMLASMTSKTVRMGPSGAGYVSKLCQLHLNYLVAQGLGEALMLGAKAELDLSTLLGVLQSSCAQSYVVDNYIPKILDGSYDPTFTLGLAQKDMRLVTELGRHLQVPLLLADDVYASYQQATKRYGAEQPHLKIVKLLEDETGRLLR